MLFFNIKEQHFYNSDEDAVSTEQAKPYATLKFLNFGLLPLFPIAINKSALADDKRKSVTTRSVPLFSVLNKFVGSLIFLFVAAWYWSNYTAKIEYEKMLFIRHK